MEYIQEQIKNYHHYRISGAELVNRLQEYINDDIEDDLGNLDLLIAIKDFVNSNDLSWSIVAYMHDYKCSLNSVSN